MKRWPLWLGLAAGLATIVAGLSSGATTQEGWLLAARWTARTCFPLFVVTFVASAAARLFPSAATRTLLRNRRYWGLGFAACFGAHLVSLLVNNWLKGNFPPAGPTNPGFWVYALMLAMVLTSNNAAQRRLGIWWKVLHRIGMWGYWFIFGISPYVGSILALEWPDPSPFTDPYFVICMLAAVLKLLAWGKTRAARYGDSSVPSVAQRSPR